MMKQQTRRAKILNLLRPHRLLLSILVGVVLGCVIGISCHSAVQKSQDPSHRRLAMYIKFPGELFIRMLKLIVIPLLSSSIIVALNDTDIKSAGRLGRRTMLYYITTTVFAATLGLILATIIKPGSVTNSQERTSNKSSRNTVDTFLDLLRNAFPDNMMEMFFTSVHTNYKKAKMNYRYEHQNTTNMSAEAMSQLFEKNKVVMTHDGQVTLIKYDVTYEYGGNAKGEGMNTIGLIVFSIAFGIVLNMIKEDGLPLVNMFRSLWTATMKLVEIIMWLSPIGICSMIAGNIIEASDITLLFRAMGLFVLTNIVAYLIQTAIFYQVLYIVLIRANPFKHLKGILSALLTAFGTSSSAATLPTTIECCECNLKIDKRVTRFVLPIGATCNMDGSAIFFSIVVLFVEQMEPNIQLGIAERILTVFISTVLSIGAAGVPAPGLSYLVIVLQAAGLPIDKIGPILTVDWLLERLRTAINVMGDTFAAALVAKFSKQDFGNEIHGSHEMSKNVDDAVPAQTEERYLKIGIV